MPDHCNGFKARAQQNNILHCPADTILDQIRLRAVAADLEAAGLGRAVAELMARALKREASHADAR